MEHLTGRKQQNRFSSWRNINAWTHYYENLSGLGLQILSVSVIYDSNTSLNVWTPLKEIFSIGVVLMKSLLFSKLWEVVIQHDGIQNVDHPLLLKMTCQAFYIIIVWTWICNYLLWTLVPNLSQRSGNLWIYFTGNGSIYHILQNRNFKPSHLLE